MGSNHSSKSYWVLYAADLDALIVTLRKRQYTVLGPVLRDQAIVCDEISGISDLPHGISDEHGPGRYHLKTRQGDARFAYAAGPHSPKNFLHPARTKVAAFERTPDGAVTTTPMEEPDGAYAFLGVRSCDLHAMRIQHKVLAEGTFTDSHYASRSKKLLLVVVQCTRPGANCFCASMNTGPRAKEGFDVALTEITGEQTWYLAECGSDAGLAVIEELSPKKATADQVAAAEEKWREAEMNIKKTLETKGLKELLIANLEHKEWDQVASRCLSCANCTMVCPTCFCTTVQDINDLEGRHSERWRTWDSCFSVQFSYIHGGPVRPSVRSRYRQWLTHKLANWQDRFGSFGCVGCGRCITWCPSGIDLTEEVRIIQQTNHNQHKISN